MSMTRWACLTGLAVLLTLLGQRAAAQPQVETTEVVVNGPRGALLLMDGQAKGKLPLPVNLVVPAGPHRFRLELGNQGAESDTLAFPGNGQAELNLTLTGRSLVAVLRVTDGLLLSLGPDSLPGALKSEISAAVAAAAKQEHSVLLGSDKQAALLRSKALLTNCLEHNDCHEPLLRDVGVSYVLSVQVETGRADRASPCLVKAALLDVRTHDVSASAEEACTAADGSGAAPQVGALAARLLQSTAVRPRGGMAVTSTPAGAKVLADGRWLGVTPLQQEAFAGARVIEVQYDRYLPYKETVQVEPNQTAALNAVLQRVPAAPLPRPLWRIVTGSILIGGGLILGGFGTSALVTNGQCQDGSSNIDTCTPFYSTTAIGGGLLGTGAALTIAGVVMLAIPNPQGSH